MLHRVTFQCGLVGVKELKYSQAGHAYLQLSVARNYSVKVDDGWENLPPVFVNLTLFGKTAELFAQSNIPLGSPLLVVASVAGRMQGPFTTKDGVQVDARVEEQYFVDAIGPMIGLGRACSTFWPDREDKPSQSQSGAKSVQQAVSAGKPAQASSVQATQADETKPAKDDSDDIFGDDLFAEESGASKETSTDYVDDFDDIF